MNLFSLSNPTPTFNPPIAPLHPTKSSLIIRKSVSGFFNVPKWVSNLRNPVFDSKFNLGYLNWGKRVSKSCFNLRNGGGLVKVSCGGLESKNEEDVFYMRKCIELAKQAIGCTSPNPMVGCIVVKDGKVVGQGFHPKAGQPHAEVFALRDAGEQAEGATAYVTLEPCNHYGRTPPCSEALIKAKVKKVVVGMVDPNPIVSSRGINKLQEAGIEVVVGVEEDSCKKLNEAFIYKMLSGKPFVTLRYSISMNAVLLDQLGEKVMECGGYYSQLLQEYDAVIHAPTEMIQDSSFLASQEPNARQPLHVFIAKDPDSLYQNLNLPVEADFKAIIFSDKEATQGLEMSQKGIETVVMNDISLDAILEYCSRQGICNVLVDFRGKKLDVLEEILGEGFSTNLVQKVVVEVLPIWAGNETGLSSSKMTSLSESKRLKNLLTKITHGSVLLEGYL
ncbi:Riboflavin biosynthesis protein PYRD chloroplastic [Bienertia sinuspersici]